MPVPRRYRLAIVVTHPVAYFAALYRALAVHPEIDLTVYFASDIGIRDYYDRSFNAILPGDPTLVEGYKHVFLSQGARRAPGGPFWSIPGWKLLRELPCGHDAVLIQGYRYLQDWLAFALGLLTTGGVLMREPATLLDHRSLPRRLAKQLVLRVLCQATYGLYVGTHNRRYLRAYGMPAKRLFLLPNAVDNTYFAARARELQPFKRSMREHFGLDPDKPVLLCCGNLTANKRPLYVLEAFRAVRKHISCSLLFAGDGPERHRIEAQAAASAPDDVRVSGPLTADEVCKAYAAADSLAVVSEREIWALVVNEAMNFGLPVVVTDSVGCAPDLVKHGTNGFVVPKDDQEALTRAVARLMQDQPMRKAFGEASRRLIAPWTIETGVNNVVEACRQMRTLR